MLDEVVFWLPPISIPLLEENDHIVLTGIAHLGIIRLELLSAWGMANVMIVTIGMEVCTASQPSTLFPTCSRYSARQEDP